MRKLYVTCNYKPVNYLYLTFLNQLFVEETFEQFALLDKYRTLDFVNWQMNLLKFRLLFSALKIKQLPNHRARESLRSSY